MDLTSPTCPVFLEGTSARGRHDNPWRNTTIHRITSDASVIEGKAAFALTVILASGETLQQEHPHPAAYCSRVELAGYLQALKLLTEDGIPAVILHDQDSLQMMLTSRVSFQAKLEPEVSELATATKTRKIFFVRTTNESEHRECHHRVRKFLKNLPAASASE